ncbi:hypothetical protein JM93_03891 [Roseibium hamelinense]|uniref:DUF1513 domain-containing protein n=1 Tax=Roseibium hamelinense TaxID=150831 RepID=A0A562SL52_9HYPH|nr:DUF1513 domain-containing protein [Roseibium hamelinense]MTI43467.1 DUF1513 domain-containing protein [Roseibium hamelinense]TWI81928.1 hypothetical protein JM93_03891 [Roseibium hamelinense]
MPLMATDRVVVSRRNLLRALGSLAPVSLFAPVRAAFAGSLLDLGALETPMFASARREADGSYAIALTDDAGFVLAMVPLPVRGHGIAVAPDRTRLVAFARRPGTVALVIAPFENTAPLVIQAAAGRHFYGHGCFSKDGRLIYAVENDFDQARGVVGVYDASGASVHRIGELDTFGVGPHDILLSPDGRTLIVANGGIETHPARPREKLNLPTMAPSIVFLDSDTGALKAKQVLDRDMHQLSLRHMAQDDAGRIWVGGQFEGSESETPPLVCRLSEQETPVLYQVPTSLSERLKNYIGSVTANRSGNVIATSAPRGGQILFWNAADGAFLGTQAVEDGCGVAPLGNTGFMISDGTGALHALEHPEDRPQVLMRPAGVAWDNHLFVI